jgi:hypothetical protein
MPGSSLPCLEKALGTRLPLFGTLKYGIPVVFRMLFSQKAMFQYGGRYKVYGEIQKRPKITTEKSGRLFYELAILLTVI